MVNQWIVACEECPELSVSPWCKLDSLLTFLATQTRLCEFRLHGEAGGSWEEYLGNQGSGEDLLVLEVYL